MDSPRWEVAAQLLTGEWFINQETKLLGVFVIMQARPPQQDMRSDEKSSFFQALPLDTSGLPGWTQLMDSQRWEGAAQLPTGEWFTNQETKLLCVFVIMQARRDITKTSARLKMVTAHNITKTNDRLRWCNYPCKAWARRRRAHDTARDITKHALLKLSTTQET